MELTAIPDETSVTAPEFLGMFTRAARAVIERAGYFSELDMAGDSDFGVSVSKGFDQALRRLSGSAAPSISAILAVTGETFSMEVGSTIGVLWGSALAEAAKVTEGREAMDAAGLAKVLNAMLSSVRSTGGASMGDKTLLDSLAPAALAAERVASENGGFGLALLQAASAAEASSKSTADWVARVGRASYLGERSRGREDPGAALVAFFLRSMCESAPR